jgi:3-hydroxyisobutyrate dehydrogenase-like beta-hydroxyacid dehydrogenase
MLPRPDVLREAVLGKSGLAEGMQRSTILIDMATDGIVVVRDMSEALRPKGIRVMDAPVGKGPWAAEKGDLTILMGGDDRFRRHIEAAYLSAWEIRQRGESPRNFRVEAAP